MKKLGDTEKVVSWKSEGLSTATDNIFSPLIKWYKNLNFCLIFKGSCLKQQKATYTHPNIIIYFIVYELDKWSQDLNSDFTLRDCLFQGVTLAKNADLVNYVYNGYSAGFNLHSEFSLPDGSVGKNVIIFGLI